MPARKGFQGQGQSGRDDAHSSSLAQLLRGAENDVAKLSNVYEYVPI